MEEFIAFTLFGSVIWFSIVVLVLLGSIIWSEYEENGFGAAISVGTALIVNHFWGDFPIMEYLSWEKIALYVGIGFGFAIIRTFFKGRELTTIYNKEIKDDEERELRYSDNKNLPDYVYVPDETLVEFKERFALKEHIFRWWFLFPVCMLSWFFGSILKDIGNYLYENMGGLFNKILNL